MTEDAITITGLLRKQHDDFRRCLKELGGLLSLHGPSGAEETEIVLGRLITPLMIHERIENELLFPTIQEYSKDLKPELLGLFQGTHKEVHEHLDALQDVLQEKDAMLSRLVSGVDFIELLREHFEQEEVTLFPLFEKVVPKEVQRELGARALRFNSDAAKRRKSSGGVL